MLTLSSSRSLVVGLSVRRFYLCDSSDSGHQNKSPKKFCSPKNLFHNNKSFTKKTLSQKKISPNNFFTKNFFTKKINWKNSNCDISKSQNCYKTQIMTKLKIQVVTKLKNFNCDKTQLVKL